MITINFCIVIYFTILHYYYRSISTSSRERLVVVTFVLKCLDGSGCCYASGVVGETREGGLEGGREGGTDGP